MSVLSLVDRQQHVDRRWEDAAKNIGAKRICRQLVIHCVSIAKRICRQHGIHHRWPFERDWATEKGYSLGDEILVEGISLSTHAELVWRLQLIYISWLGRFSPRPSALPRGGLIAGPIALSSSVAATNNITQCVRQDQIGSGASGSENERTREQKDPKEKRKSITIDDLLVFQGKKTREEVAEILCVSLSTVKRTWTTSGRGTWKNGGRKKVLRPPDQHGERNTSTARETPSHNVQTGIEGVPVGQNQEANEFRPDFTEGSIPSNTENGLIIGSSFGFPPPQITSMPSEYMGGSIDLRNSLANLTFATCSDQAAPSQHVQVSKPPDQHGERNTSTACEAPPHNVQTGIEGESVGHSPACFTVQTLSPRPSARRTPAPTAEPSIPLEDRQQEENEASFVDTTSITYSNLSHLCEGENIVQTDDILGGQGSAALWDYTIDFGMGEQNREVETREQPSPQRSPAADRGKGPANNEMEMPIRLFPLANLVEEVCHPLLNTIARAHPETFAHFNPRTPLLGSMLLRNLHDLLVPWARLRFDEFTLAKETAMQELSQDLVSLGFDLGWLSARGSALRAAKERVALQPEIQSLSALVESTRESLANLEARLAQAKRQDAELAAAALNLADLGPSELVFEELAS